MPPWRTGDATLPGEVRLTLSFLSRIPVGGRGEIRNIPRHFGLVGYLPGLLYVGGRAVSRDFLWTLAVISVVFFLFDLFHVDGLLDTLDGLLNQGDRAKRLAIMSKGDTGPFAIFYFAIFVAAFLYSFQGCTLWAPLWAAVAARLSMNAVLAVSKPAKEGGLGALLFPYPQSHSLISLVWTLPLLVLDPLAWAVAVGASILTGLVLALAARKLLGGITGDILGASCLAGQLSALVALFYLHRPLI